MSISVSWAIIKNKNTTTTIEWVTYKQHKCVANSFGGWEIQDKCMGRFGIS